MGWSPGDAEQKELIRVQLAKARSEVYKLRSLINNIGHADKREAMLRVAIVTSDNLDSIDCHLNR